MTLKTMIMSLFNNKYRSQSHRWQFWDYSAPGAYFITFISYERLSIFGEIEGGEMILSEEGEIAKNNLTNLKFNNLFIDQYVIMPNHVHLIIVIPDLDDTDSEFYQKLIDKNVKNVKNDLAGNGDNSKIELDGNNQNPMNELLVTGYVDTIHELYLRGYSQSKSFFKHHFPQTPYRNPDDLPDDLKKYYKKIRRKMAIPLAMGKLKHQISKEINVLNDTPGKTNWQPDYYDIIVRNSIIFKAYGNYIQTNPKKWTSDRFFK